MLKKSEKKESKRRLSDTTPTSSSNQISGTAPAVLGYSPIVTNELPLPEGWECRYDSQGRKYYVDHISKTTSW